MVSVWLPGAVSIKVDADTVTWGTEIIQLMKKNVLVGQFRVDEIVGCVASENQSDVTGAPVSVGTISQPVPIEPVPTPIQPAPVVV